MLNISDNKITIIKPNQTYYDVVYSKDIKTPKKDIYEAYKTLLKLNKEK